jgi:phage-related protein
MQAHVLKPPGPARRLPIPTGVRARLKLGATHDEAERQADRIAARALAAPVPGSNESFDTRMANRHAVRRAVAPTADEHASPDRLAAPAEDEQALPDQLERDIAALQQGGQPLPPPLRRDMEARFGIDLAAVRIHTDERAAGLNERLHAHAFTVGEHIAFNAGRFRPEHPAGRFLLAHELAHVAQQRGDAGRVEAAPVRRGFWGDLYDSAAGALGDIADWAIDRVREYGWRLIEAISPEFARTVRAILDEGILAWLGRQVARAWDAYIATLRALVPFEGPRQLIDLFAGLVERAARIAVALASGDCAPLMAAIAEMKTFVTEVVGVAWNRLSEFLQPIGEFFSGLWNDLGAPAVQWLQEFGGEVWSWIQDLGRQFWDWISPVREAAGRIWNWFSDLLFGSAGVEEGSSSGGVVGWVTRKAGEAWDWVKERTRPVWQPVAEFAGRVAELIPPAFVREMGENAQQMATQLDTAAADMNGGEGVPQSRDTLAAVLPSVETLLATVRRIIVGAGAWLGERIAAIGGLVTGLVTRLRANALLSWLATAFGWLAEAVDTLVGWARNQVATLFDFLVRGFDALTPFLQLVLDTVRRAIGIYADLLQLPLLILNSIWQRVPACIRDPVENFIRNQILARIPVFGQFFTDPELWPRVQQTALDILRRLFVDGDLPGAAWAFFQAVLRLLGLPPELVVQVLAKAARALGDILTNPIGFLINLLRAMGAGFTGFFSNIGTHLLTGFTGWLFSTVREAGIQPPADFSLRSVLGFVMDVLGVTVDNIFARLARRLDPAIVARLRSMLEVATGVWSFVSTLVTEGPAGLWRELTERLSSLWDRVVQGVVGFITERVIGWASRWLVSLLDVTGIMPVINTLLAIYRAIESFMQYLRQMLEIVSRVLDGVIGIARGAIEEGAAFMENALASALPVAIGFLANQAGLGRLSERLREILASLRERVEAAIDWLIDRALRAGRAVIDLIKRGVGAVRQWWKQRFGFQSADGESHALYMDGESPDAELMVASTPMTYREFLDSIPETPANRAAKQKATQLNAEFVREKRLAAQERRSGTAVANKKGDSDTHSATLVDRIQKIAEATAALMPADPNRSTAPRFDTVNAQGYGKRIRIDRLTSDRKHWPIRGSEPTARSPRWNRLAQRATDGNAGDYLYIRGHLLNHNLDGPGNLWENLAPITQDANNRKPDSMLHAFETKVKDTVDEKKGKTGRGRVEDFDVKADYDERSRSAHLKAIDAELAKSRGVRSKKDLSVIRDIVVEEQYLPRTVTCSAELVHADGKREALRKIVRNTITENWDAYTLVSR